MLTVEQLRNEGLKALEDRLGRAGMVRFLQLFESGSGDYSAERHAWVDKTSLKDLKLKSAKRPRKSRKR